MDSAKKFVRIQARFSRPGLRVVQGGAIVASMAGPTAYHVFTTAIAAVEELWPETEGCLSVEVLPNRDLVVHVRDGNGRLVDRLVACRWAAVPLTTEQIEEAFSMVHRLAEWAAFNRPDPLLPA